MTQSKGLENYVKMQIEPGTGGSFADCSGFVPDTTPAPAPVSLLGLKTFMYDYATGGNAWTTGGTPGEHKSYTGVPGFSVSTRQV